MDEDLPQGWDSFLTSIGETPETFQAQLTASTPPVEGVVPPAEPVVDAPVVAAPVEAAPVVAPQPDQQLLRLALEQSKNLQAQLDQVKAAQAKAAEPVAPDPAIDPLGAILHQNRQMQAAIQALQDGQTQQTQQTQQQTQMSQFLGAVNAQVDVFRATTPDYTDAYTHLINVKVSDFMEQGLSKDEARNLVSQEEMKIAANALRQGKNPGAVAYEMAKRSGYVAKAAPVVTTPDSKLDTIRKGLEAEKEVEKGVQTTDKVTVATLREMKDSDLNRAVENDWEGIFGKPKGIF